MNGLVGQGQRFANELMCGIVKKIRVAHGHWRTSRSALNVIVLVLRK